MLAMRPYIRRWEERMLSRTIVLLMICGLAACERPTAPAAMSRPAAHGPSFDDNTVKDNETLDLAGTLISPCTGEQITFAGSAHIVATFTPTADGFTVATHFNTQGVSGVSAETGTKYQLIEITSEEDQVVASDPATGSGDVHTAFHVISDGSLDNFLVDAIYTFTFPPPTATYKLQNARCTG